MKRAMAFVLLVCAPGFAAAAPAPARSVATAVSQQEQNKAVARRVFDESFSAVDRARNQHRRDRLAAPNRRKNRSARHYHLAHCGWENSRGMDGLRPVGSPASISGAVEMAAYRPFLCRTVSFVDRVPADWQAVQSPLFACSGKAFTRLNQLARKRSTAFSRMPRARGRAAWTGSLKVSPSSVEPTPTVNSMAWDLMEP